MRQMPQRQNISRTEARDQGHSDLKQRMTLSSPKMYLHTELGIPTSYNIRGMLQTGFFLKLRLEVKVTMTQKQYTAIWDLKCIYTQKLGFLLQIE